ncbi:MFS transporter [Pseudovibrio denitrificans]|uniref:MFS transporter n=1 Tax=Pseudovibrio denitrificans TaxID=258256 RepID=UPI0039BFC306
MKHSDTAVWRMTIVMAASGFAITIMKLALPALTGALGHSSAAIGLVAGSIAVSWPLFGLLVGWGVDRYGRAPAFRAGLIVAAIVAAAFLITADAGEHLLLLCAFGVLIGVSEVLTETSSQTILPDLIGQEHLHKGNSMLQGAKTISATLGAPLVLALLLDYSVQSIFLIAFIGVILSFLVLPRPKRFTPSTQKGFRGFFDGAKLLWKRRDLRAFTVLVTLMATSWGAWFTLIVPFALQPEQLDLGASGVGYLVTAVGCGSLLGAFGYQRIRSKLGDTGTRAIDVITTLLFVLVPALGLGLTSVLLSAVLAGIGGVTWMISIAAYQQQTISGEALGRTVAAYRWMGWSGFFAGASFSGLCAEMLGLQSAFLLFALPAVAAVIIFWRTAPDHAQSRATPTAADTA